MLETFEKTRLWWEFIEDKLKEMENQGKFWTDALELTRTEDDETIFHRLKEHFEKLLIFDSDLTVSKFEMETWLLKLQEEQMEL